MLEPGGGESHQPPPTAEQAKAERIERIKALGAELYGPFTLPKGLTFRQEDEYKNVEGKWRAEVLLQITDLHEPNDKDQPLRLLRAHALDLGGRHNGLVPAIERQLKTFISEKPQFVSEATLRAFAGEHVALLTNEELAMLLQRKSGREANAAELAERAREIEEIQAERRRLGLVQEPAADPEDDSVATDQQGEEEVQQPESVLSEERGAPYIAELPGRNFYTILGLTKAEVDADPGVLKRKYRELARKYHPSSTYVTKHGPDDAERFKDIAEAYEVLSDPTKSLDYDKGYGRYGDTDHPNRPYVPPQNPENTNFEQPQKPETQPESPKPEPEKSEAPPKPPEWWETYYSGYDNFSFEGLDDEGKPAHAERSHMQPPDKEGVRERERAARDRLTASANETIKLVHASLDREIKKETQKLLEALQKGKITSAEYKKASDAKTDKYYKDWYRTQREIYSKRFHQEAKWGVMGLLRQQATAAAASEIETAIHDRLLQEEHASVEPKIYSLPDGTFVRVTWLVVERDTPFEVMTTTIEHITGAKDEYGGLHTKGVEILREGQNSGNTFWLRRITRPYNMHLLDLSQRMNAGSLYSDNFEPYGTILTEGDITKSELKEYMAMLQHAAPAMQRQEV